MFRKCSENEKRLSLRVWASLICGLFLLGGFGQAEAFQLFSSGMQTPEIISPVPAGSYGGVHDGNYFVPDPGRTSGSTESIIWKVPVSGGTPSKFVTYETQTMNASTVGGLFLPTGPYWGANAGKYLTVGWQAVGTDRFGRVNVYEGNGTYTTVWEAIGHLPKVPVLAPDGWGAFGNQMILSDGGPAVYALDNTFTKTTVVTNPIIPETARFGLAFAPDNWGSVGGLLLANTDIGGVGKIFAIAPDGSESLWTDFALQPDQNGPRHMAFSPAGWFGPEPSLLVSISGSYSGGGFTGDILVFDSTGAVVKHLRPDLGLTKFDPRGLYFTDDGKLLISDASDPIYLATQADFATIPVPPSLFLLGPGLAGLLAWRRFRKTG